MKKAVIGLLIILLGAAAYYYFSTRATQSEQPTPAQPVVIEQATPMPEPEPEPELPRLPEPETPVVEPEPVAEAEPLPPLNESDAMVLESLSGALGEANVIQGLR